MLHRPKKKIDSKYYNITEKECKLFQDLCNVCITKNQKTKKLPGCDKPIESFQFRDRFQIDLIDYQKESAPLWYWEPKSPLMNWLMVLKDHYTRIIYARPLKRKSAAEVAFELKSILALIGFPLIFHTDNGKEFCDSVIAEMRIFNPHLISVHGRPRTPRDQGSVERVNGPIKGLIDSLVLEKKHMYARHVDGTNKLSPHMAQACEHASWVTSYPDAVHEINGNRSYGVGSVQSYETVFGMDLQMPKYEALIELAAQKKLLPGPGEAWTVERLANLLPTSEYKDKMIFINELDEHGKENGAAANETESLLGKNLEMQNPVALSVQTQAVGDFSNALTTESVNASIAQLKSHLDTSGCLQSPELSPKSSSVSRELFPESSSATKVKEEPPVEIDPMAQKGFNFGARHISVAQAFQKLKSPEKKLSTHISSARTVPGTPKD